MTARKRQQTPFDFWISFSPMAPFFGVEWRFEKMILGAQFFRPMEVVAQMAAASVQEVARATEAGSRAVVGAAEVVAENAAAVGDQIEAEVIAEAVGELAEVVAHVAPPEQVAAQTNVSQAAAPADPTQVAAPDSRRPATLFDAAPENADDLKHIKGGGAKA